MRSPFGKTGIRLESEAEWAGSIAQIVAILMPADDKFLSSAEDFPIPGTRAPFKPSSCNSFAD